MHSMISRRQILAAPLAAAAVSASSSVFARPKTHFSGNPLRLPAGICDPQIRVYDDTVWLYATHDSSLDNKFFVMKDWQIWRTRNLIDWSHAGTLLPEQTYLRKPSSECWATDAARRNGRYYLYFSMGPKNIGVVVADTPAGPWRDPLGRPLIADGQVATEARDPGILQEPDGTSYLVFGTWDYYIARLNEDMVSLAEKPRLLTITEKEGPYGHGKTDDKPFLHRRGKTYYLSWGSYYAMGSSPYGPFRCKGSLLDLRNVDPAFRNLDAVQKIPPQYRPTNFLNSDRHGSFFEWRGSWFFVCNDVSQPGSSPFFRRSVICDVEYLANDEIAPLRLNQRGVQVPRRR